MHAERMSEIDKMNSSELRNELLNIRLRVDALGVQMNAIAVEIFNLQDRYREMLGDHEWQMARMRHVSRLMAKL